MRLDDLANKRVGIVGFGMEGQATLARLPDSAAVTIYDERPVDAPGVSSVAGLAKVADEDVIIKSPGISLYHPAIQKAIAAGVPCTSATALWFAEQRSAPVIAVTGTKGKSTVASLIHFLAQKAGLECALGGNIGVPVWDLPASADCYVIEMSSYQAADFSGRPAVAVLTNLYPEHLDWHRAEEIYYRDKCRIFDQSPDVAVINGLQARSLEWTADVPHRTLFGTESGWHVIDGGLYRQGSAIKAPLHWNLLGAHNALNLCAALTAVEAVVADVTPGLNALAEFKSLPHRLERLPSSGRVAVIDDSIATTPHATLAAIRALETDVVVIVGGFDRCVDWSEFAIELRTSPVAHLVIQGQNGSHIDAQLGFHTPNQPRTIAVDFADAVKLGHARASEIADTRPITLLLSPGAPAFDAFKNYRERGQVFRELLGLPDSSSS